MTLRPGSRWLLPTVLAVTLAAAACGDGGDGGDGSASTESSEVTEGVEATEAGGDDASVEVLHPDVVGVAATRSADGTWSFDVTLSSPYDSPARYADAWRVVGPDGEVYGIRELAHDHAAEQPFTRSQSGIVIPDGVGTVTVEGRDQVSGWGGETVEYVLEP